MNAVVFLKENLAEIHDMKLWSTDQFAESIYDKGCITACNDRKIRDLGLTTPDKPVARRPSTFPAQSRGTDERTNVGSALLCTNRRYCACCSLFPLSPHNTVPPMLPAPSPCLSLPCTPSVP